ncbi:hypothetical protein [Paraburkholderia sp. C35]|uniref:hypothetical protein n=1 Tax=Paraburkholderia sp. C35 TaxID=2126993 RepID=UPI000D68B452|nr:hypothetical protein [Paraburkholderia sp. C35]
MKLYGRLGEDGIAAARALLDSAPREKIDDALSKWWVAEFSSDDDGVDSGRTDTSEIAARLREAGLTDMAEFVERPVWLEEGPIHPGQWGIAVLLGQSIVSVFLTTLASGKLVCPRFYGLDKLGAQEAFEEHLCQRLREDVSGREAALAHVRRGVDELKADPDLAFSFAGRYARSIRRDCELFASAPSIDVAWQHDLDNWANIRWSFVVNALLRAECTEILALLTDLPHPSLVKRALRPGEHGRSPESIALMLRASPPAFDNAGTFLVSGSLAAVALEQAYSAIDATVLDDEGYLKVAPRGQPNELDSDFAKLRSAAHQILDALFSRTDATSLAWAWLERSVMVGGARKRFRSSKEALGICLDVRMFLMEELSQRVSPREDWREWVAAAGGSERVYRAIAASTVLAHQVQPEHGQVAAPIEYLFESEIDYPGVGSMLTEQMHLLSRLSAHIVSKVAAPDRWILRLWESLRRTRERNWLRHSNGHAEHNAAQFFVAIAVAAVRVQVDCHERTNLWHAVERCVRDAIQTEPSTPDFWSNALVTLFAHVSPCEAAETSVCLGSQLSEALVHYVSPDRRFMSVLLTLHNNGFTIDALKAACIEYGFDLRHVINHYLAMIKRHESSRHFDSDHAKLVKKILASC